jgi:hypothetical protein
VVGYEESPRGKFKICSLAQGVDSRNLRFGDLVRIQAACRSFHQKLDPFLRTKDDGLGGLEFSNTLKGTVWLFGTSNG